MPRKKHTRRSDAPIVTAGSASRVFNYEKCPAKIRFAAEGYREQTGPALERGKRIHKLGENYLKGIETAVPEAYKHFEDRMKRLKKQGALPEVRLSFTPEWKLCDWMAPDVWVRMAVDALLPRKTTMLIVDFKTGKPWPDHDDQGDLYAVGGFHAHPRINKIKVEFWYLDIGDRVELDYTRGGDLAVAQAAWEKRINTMVADLKMAPTPNKFACRYCGFGKSKTLKDGTQGPCQDEVKA